MERKSLFNALASMAFAVTVQSAAASVISLDFEGINATYPSAGDAFINGFYNGGTSSDGTSGPNYGIAFPANAQAICLNTPGFICSNTSRGGQGDPNSQLGALFFLSGDSTFLNDVTGFDTGLSFYYSAVNVGGSINVWSGLNGTGGLLASLPLPVTASGPCEGYGAGFCPFFATGIGFPGTAQSVEFVGVADQIVFDDVTFGSTTPGGVPEPGSLLLLAGGMAAAGLSRRRRQTG